MIRILSDNDSLNTFERAEVEGIEDKASGRVNAVCTVLCLYKLCKPDKIIFFKFREQVFFGKQPLIPN